MDIFAHGLWVGATYNAAKKETKKPLRVVLAVFCGVFPDFFAFVPAFAYLFYQAIFGGKGFISLREHLDIESSTVAHQVPLYDLSNTLYSLSHSLLIFLIVFGLVWALRKRPLWELGGWLIHILIDIPTHSYKFFPTPFLWPLSDFKVNGILWGAPWFMILNYGSLLVLYIVLSRRGLQFPLRNVIAILVLVLISALIASFLLA